MSTHDDFATKARDVARGIVRDTEVSADTLSDELLEATLAYAYGKGWIEGASETHRAALEIMGELRAALLEAIRHA